MNSCNVRVSEDAKNVKFIGKWCWQTVCQVSHSCILKLMRVGYPVELWDRQIWAIQRVRAYNETFIQVHVIFFPVFPRCVSTEFATLEMVCNCNCAPCALRDKIRIVGLEHSVIFVLFPWNFILSNSHRIVDPYRTFYPKYQWALTNEQPFNCVKLSAKSKRLQSWEKECKNLSTSFHSNENQQFSCDSKWALPVYDWHAFTSVCSDQRKLASISNPFPRWLSCDEEGEQNFASRVHRTDIVNGDVFIAFFMIAQ